MTDLDAYRGKPLGTLLPIIVRSEEPPASTRVARLSNDLANVTERRFGWWQPLDVQGVPGGVKVGRVRSTTRPNLLTGGTNDELAWSHIADLPLKDFNARLLLVGAGDEGRDLLRDLYLKSIGTPGAKCEYITIDSEVMKKVLQKGVPEVLTAVESEEKSLTTDYMGESEIRSPRQHDVRNAKGFTDMLEAPWKRMRFIPSMGRFAYDGFPPTVELSAENTFRMWVRWDDDSAIHFALQLVEFIISLGGEKLDENALLKAADPPYRQKDLSEFF